MLVLLGEISSSNHWCNTWSTMKIFSKYVKVMVKVMSPCHRTLSLLLPCVKKISVITLDPCLTWWIFGISGNVLFITTTNYSLERSWGLNWNIGLAANLCPGANALCVFLFCFFGDFCFKIYRPVLQMFGNVWWEWVTPGLLSYLYQHSNPSHLFYVSLLKAF